MKFKTFCRECLVFSIGLSTIAVICAIVGIFLLELELPNVSELRNIHLQVPLQIFTRDGQLMAEFGDVQRIPVSLDQVPKQLIEATIATEDQRFYSHPGVDFFGLVRASIVLITTGKKWQGGSTITMQVARSFFLSPKKTFTRKLKEILLALKIDHEFSKDKILELYFNQNFYGSRAYGIAAAARIYYDKSLDQLTLPEMAMLAGLPQAPSKLNPLTNPVAAKDRRDHVLRRMLDLNFINRKTYLQATQTPVIAEVHGLKMPAHAPYVAEMARQLLIQQYGDDVYDQGLKVYTTIDSNLQAAANLALQKDLQAYDHRHGYVGPEQTLSALGQNEWLLALQRIPTINGLRPAVVTAVQDQSIQVLIKTGQAVTIPWSGLSWARKRIVQGDQDFVGAAPRGASDIVSVGDVVRVVKNQDDVWVLTQVPQVEAALVALNPNDGAILALNGGFNYYKSKFNRIVQAERQPGSGFKPFIYSAALAKGFTLATVINDAPIAIANAGSEEDLWRPQEDTKKFYGPTRLREALTKSRNLVSIRLLDLIGIPYAINYVIQFGFDPNQLPQTLSMALGSGTVTPLQLVTGYAVFANGGYRVHPYFIDHIVDHRGETIYRSTPIAVNDTKHPAPRVITPENDYLITSTLKDVIRFGTGIKALSLHRNDIAGKTGTTNKQTDVWFSGYNHNLVATVWIGYDQPRSLHEDAYNSAVPMWADFMQQALQGQPEADVPVPAGIVTLRIDKKTGLLAPANSQNAISEIFDKNAVPTELTPVSSADYGGQPASPTNAAAPTAAQVSPSASSGGQNTADIQQLY